MNKTRIFSGLLGLFASASVFALGYQSMSEPPSGARAKEIHAVQFKTEAADCPVLAVCLAAASVNSEFSAIVEVTNTTTCSSATGTCTPVPAVDNYAGFGGIPSVGATPSAPYSTIFLPGCPVGSAPCLRDLVLSSSFYAWDFNTDESGKITDGYFIADSTFAGSGTVGVFIFPDMVVRTYRGDGATGLPTPGDVACAADTSTDFTTCWVDDAGSTDDGPATEQEFDYVTVPMDDLTLTKSVPMPAFAALVLAGGLASITLVTRRRRS